MGDKSKVVYESTPVLYTCGAHESSAGPVVKAHDDCVILTLVLGEKKNQPSPGKVMTERYCGLFTYRQAQA
jgi:hypothetical protein